jgi:hypothetical protein
MGTQTHFSVATALTLSALLWAGPAGAEEQTTSLYERLGGAYAIATVVMHSSSDCS